MVPFSRVAVVFNSSKSRRRLRTYCEAANARLAPSDGTLAVYASSSPTDLQVQARLAVDDGYELIVAAGGDGTLFGVLQAVRGLDVALTVLPLGTCNDYAKALGIQDERDAVNMLTTGSARWVDLGTCSYVGLEREPREAVFCLSAGLGFSAALAQAESSRLLAALKRGLGNHALILASAKLVATYRGCQSEIVLDERRLERSVALLEVSKVARLGGMGLTPRARLDSGFLDACLFEGGLLRRGRLLLELQLSERYTSWPDFEYFSDEPSLNALGLTRVKEIRITPQRPMPLHLHGDFVGYGPARFGVLPSALRVLAPAA